MERGPLSLKIMLFTSCLLFFLRDNGWAWEKVYAPVRQEFLAGFGFSRIHDKGSYNFIPLFWDIDFDVKPWGRRIGVRPPGVLDFVWEPAAAIVITPDSNAEVANNLLLKVGFFPSTSRWQPYFKGGVGAIFLTQHIHGQSTQFNFNEYAGLGFDYFLSSRTALTAEYRFRHVSNADIKSPNDGIGSNLVLVGVSLQF